MNARQEAKYQMYRSTQSHCNANATVIAGNAALNNAFKAFEALVEEIGNHETVIAKKITGVSKDKSQVKSSLADTAYRIASQVFAYASKAKNNSLKKQVDFSPTELLRTKDELFVPAVQNIYNAANDNAKALTDFGITQNDLNELTALMDAYKTATPTPRTAIGARAAKAKSLTELFKEADRLLKEQIDKLVTGLKKGNNLFVTEFANVRKIIDPASRPKKATVAPATPAPKV